MLLVLRLPAMALNSAWLVQSFQHGIIRNRIPVEMVVDKARFVSLIVSWLRGATYSSVLDETRDKSDLTGDFVHLHSDNGEELRLRELSRGSGIEALGFRHDFPDEDGRLWRTEAVLHRGVASDGQDIIRIRTECIARRQGARLDVPRKPYFVKTILQDRWSGRDGELAVSDQPLKLKPDQAGLEIARAITLGEATRYLPVIYVSATGSSKWLISDDQMSKLAFDVGGIAHVVAEPNRTFSFGLRDLTKGVNAYGGTLAIALPGRGIVRQFYTGLRFTDVADVLRAIREAVVSIRSQMPAEGLDWTELQERALRSQRERDRNRLQTEEVEKLYQEEIANLQDRVRQLEGQLAARSPEEATEMDDGLLPANLAGKLGPEIYPGEFSDRLRLAAKECIARADSIGLDRRSVAVFNEVASKLPPSPALNELLEDLERATKDPKRMASELISLLSQYGYREKSDNKHIRLEAVAGFEGLDAITLPKTPSENRGLKNLRKQIEATLGLTKLTK